MKKLGYMLFAAAVLFTGCSKTDMAEMNMDPSKVTTPDVRYLFTDAIYNILYAETDKESSYTEWMYDNYTYIFPYCQIGGGERGGGTATGSFDSQVRVLKRFVVFYDKVGGPVAKIRNMVATDERLAPYKHLAAMTYPIHIWCGLRATDLTGSMPYSEALGGWYGGTLTPKFDTQKELYTQWDKELKDAIATLSQNTIEGVNQNTLASNVDLIYGGDVTKWIKFCNTLRLKIAVRLINNAPQWASQIAQEVVQDGRIMDSNDDDFYWYGGSKFRHTVGDRPSTATKPFVDMLRNNLDPRLLFYYEKNGYNADVIQQFLDTDAQSDNYVSTGASLQKLPAIWDAAIIETDATGRRIFKGWKTNNNVANPDAGKDLYTGDPGYVDENLPDDPNHRVYFWGEPWVRYQGIPITVNNTLRYANDYYNQYFGSSSLRQIKTRGADGKPTTNNRSFAIASMPSDLLVQPTGNDYWPTADDVRTQYQSAGNYAFRAVLCGAGETNLYMAEFVERGLVSGAAKTAEQYFLDGIEMSVRAMAKAAENSNVFYYTGPSDDTKSTIATETPDGLGVAVGETIDQGIALTEEMITNMFKRPLHQYTGSQSEKLEKIYINLVVDRLLTPTDVFVTCLRGGIPKKGSTIWPRGVIDPEQAYPTPRRWVIYEPESDDINITNRLAAYQEQGFTVGASAGSVLANERYWYDKGNPNWGEGPKL